MHRKLLILLLFSISACEQGPEEPDTSALPADTIFVGENIITMESDFSPISGVAVRGDEIVAVGNADSVLRFRGDKTRVVGLGDKALLPGFIDAHGHFTATARLIDFVNLSSPPVGTAENIDDIVQLLQQRITTEKTPFGDWVVGYGYDAEALATTPRPDHRSVIIHAQLMRADQVKSAAELGIIPSFFSAHSFFWGDWHRLSFGDERARNISPTRWAIDNGVDFTLHNDAPVVPPDMMRLLWASVNRTTRSGYVLGPDERLTVAEALHAMTLGGAHQFFEEDRKGSIRAGKQADFVILGENPLLADPATLKDIEVVETFSRGRSVFMHTTEH